MEADQTFEGLDPYSLNNFSTLMYQLKTQETLYAFVCQESVKSYILFVCFWSIVIILFYLSSSTSEDEMKTPYVSSPEFETKTLSVT